MKVNKKDMKDYLMVNYFDCRGYLEIREVREMKIGEELDVDFIWNYMDELYEGSYEECLVDWLGDEDVKKNFKEFLMEGKIEKEDFICLGVNEEECIMFIEGKKGEGDVLKLLEERVNKLF